MLACIPGCYIDTWVGAVPRTIDASTLPEAASEESDSADVAGEWSAARSCPASTCASGEDCCFSTGRCFNLQTERALCPFPAGGMDGGLGCAANSHCGVGAYCWSPPGECSAAGTCVTMATGTCDAFDGSDPGSLIGCDGVVYADQCAASRAGTRVMYFVGAVDP